MAKRKKIEMGTMMKIKKERERERETSKSIRKKR